MRKIKNIIEYLFGLSMLALPAFVFAAEGDHPLADLLAKFLTWLLGIFGILGLIGFVISGIMYLTAAGSETQIDTAKKSFTYSILGMLVGLMGIIIVKLIIAKISAQ